MGYKNEVKTVVTGRYGETPAVSTHMKSWLCNGDFNNEMLKDFMNFYTGLMRDKEHDTVIYINSYGGSVRIADSIISIVEHSGINFYTCAIGAAYSAALALLVTGRKRFGTGRASFLFHDISTGAMGKVDEVLEHAHESKQLSKKFLGRLSERTKKPLDWWLVKAKKKESKDFLFDARAAISYGVIDRIGVPEVTVIKKIA
jgi:ATP-dependent protease ClpP protease subunit